MFSGAARVSSNLGDKETTQIRALLRTFRDELQKVCQNLGLGTGQTPFVRPSNFVVVLNPDVVHLVIDDVPIGGMSTENYIDRRNEILILTRDDVVAIAQRELGFRAPIATLLPINALNDNEEQRKTALMQTVAQISAELAQIVLAQNLRLPQGYEHYARHFPNFLKDHPNVNHNVFLMMRFNKEKQYDEIHNALRDNLKRYNLNLLRADDKDYTGDLWENVCLYMLGANYGVGVFEEIDLREFNPSVALELGFMLAHNKRCLILKDKRMPKMPTDIIGKLYKEFDTYSISDTIEKAIKSWVNDIGLIK